MLLRNLLLVLLIFNTSCNSQTTTAGYFRVTKVVDGDTFYIDDGTARGQRIRLIGIDAPETRKSSRKEIGYYGKEASNYLSKVLKGNSIRLEYDVTRKDRYGRTLAYAYLENGLFLNADLVKKGYAMTLTLPPNVKHAALFQKLQEEARTHKRGLWGK